MDRALSGENVDCDVLTITMQQHIDARSTKLEISNDQLIKKSGHDGFSKPDLVSLVVCVSMSYSDQTFGLLGCELG